MLEHSRRVVFFFNRILGVSRFFASGRSSATLPGVSFGGVRQYGRPVRGAVVQHTSISMLCSNRSETFVFWWFAMLSCDIFWHTFLCDEFQVVMLEHDQAPKASAVSLFCTDPRPFGISIIDVITCLHVFYGIAWNGMVVL